MLSLDMNHEKQFLMGICDFLRIPGKVMICHDFLGPLRNFLSFGRVAWSARLPFFQKKLGVESAQKRASGQDIVPQLFNVLHL